MVSISSVGLSAIINVRATKDAVRYPLGAVRPVQDAVVLHESEEEGGGNTLVPIHE